MAKKDKDPKEPKISKVATSDLTTAERARRAQSFVEGVEKKSPGSVIDMNEAPEFISTGIAALDRAIGTGGTARGHNIEIYGDEGTGKSSLAMILATAFQDRGESTLWIDMEQRFWGAFALMLGVRPELFKVVRPSTGTEALQIVEEAVDTQAFSLIVVDSVAALVTDEEAAGDIGDVHMAPQGRLMSTSLRKIAPKSMKYGVTIVWVNQMRSNMARMGKTENTAGGRALKFWSSLRLELKKGESILRSTKRIGHRIKVKVEKNSWAPPYGTCSYDFRYDTGLDYIGSVIETARAIKIITLRGSAFDIPTPDGLITVSGLVKLDEMIRQNPNIFKHISELVRTSDVEIPDEEESAVPTMPVIPMAPTIPQVPVIAQG